MTTPVQVDFYLTSSTGPKSRNPVICRLAEKSFAAGKRVYVLTASPDQTAEIDALMWTYNDISFVPHACYTGEASNDPILIGHDVQPPAGTDTLINLAHPVPACYTLFERVLEIVDPEPAAIKLSRDRYRTYRDNGCDPETHKLATNQTHEPIEPQLRN